MMSGHEVVGREGNYCGQEEGVGKERKEKMTGSVEVRRARENLKTNRMKIRKLTEELSTVEKFVSEVEAKRRRIEESLVPSILLFFDKLKRLEDINGILLQEAFEIWDPHLIFPETGHKTQGMDENCFSGDEGPKVKRCKHMRKQVFMEELLEQRRTLERSKSKIKRAGGAGGKVEGVDGVSGVYVGASRGACKPAPGRVRSHDRDALWN